MKSRKMSAGLAILTVGFQGMRELGPYIKPFKGLYRLAHSPIPLLTNSKHLRNRGFQHRFKVVHAPSHGPGVDQVTARGQQNHVVEELLGMRGGRMFSTINSKP